MARRVLLLCGDYVEDYEVLPSLISIGFLGDSSNTLNLNQITTWTTDHPFLQVMVPFQALQAYGVVVDAVCPGKKAGEVCRTSVHQLSGHQVITDV